MKITLAQHGGQAAGILLKRPPLVLDMATLEASKAAELKGLVTAAMAAPPPDTRSGKARDEMSYTVTVKDGGNENMLSQSDTSMSPEFGKLLAWLQRNSR